MNNDYKKLFEVSDSIVKKQKLLIRQQEKYISELETENQKLKQDFKTLSTDYDKALSIMDRQQVILEQVFSSSSDD